MIGRTVPLRWWRCMSWSHRLALGLVVVLGLLMITPTRPAAACGFGDGGCMVDQGMYNALLIAARFLWMADRLLLVVAYLLDVIRYEIVNRLFLDAFTKLTDLVGVMVVPVAIVAASVAMLAILAAPITGTSNPFNLRQIFMIVVFAPTVLLGLGKVLGDMDQFRVDIGQQLYAAAITNSGEIGAVIPAAGDMRVPTALYPSRCPAGPLGNGADLPRRSGGTVGETVRPDELAAAYLFVGAYDLHCPDAWAAEIVSGLPAAWSDAAQTLPYVRRGDIGGEPDPNTRTQWKDDLNTGLNRLFLGFFVALLALVYYAAHLVFTLALVALFVSLPIGMLAGMFRKDFGWAGEFFSHSFGVLKNSWVTSFIIGLLMAGLLVAAKSGNATVFASLSTGALVFLIYTFLTAVGTLKMALSALASVAGAATGGAQMLAGATGIAGQGLRSLATGAATGGAGAAVGVARTAMVGAAAARESGSLAYGMAAMAGRSNVLRGAGEVARSMGMLGGEGGQAIMHGMRAGATSDKGFRHFNQQLASGAGKAGTAMKAQQAQRQEDREERQVAALREATPFQRVGAVAAAIRNKELPETLGMNADPVLAGITAAQGGVHALGRGVTDGARTVADGARAVAADPRMVVRGAVDAGRAAIQATEAVGYGAIGTAGRGVIAAAQAGAQAVGQAGEAIRRRADPNARFAQATRLDERGRQVRVTGEAAEPPEDAERKRFSDAEIRTQMRGGSTARYHEDDTWSVWTPTQDTPPAVGAPPALTQKAAQDEDAPTLADAPAQGTAPAPTHGGPDATFAASTPAFVPTPVAPVDVPAPVTPVDVLDHQPVEQMVTPDETLSRMRRRPSRRTSPHAATGDTTQLPLGLGERRPPDADGVDFS